ncbi:hypothetical protein Tco_0337548 [Tanacetum coccineum]|uniref:Uncharacterized protein n=1 Tax=Tanacetum coccineum TaxID=301880 RepID=A0ABQ5AX01_9ASTR
MSVENVAFSLVPQGQKASDYDISDPVPPKLKCCSFSRDDRIVTKIGLEFLFSPLLEEYYNPTHGQAERRQQ